VTVLSANRDDQVSKGFEFHDVQAKDSLHLAVSLGAFIVLDRCLKNVFLDYAIRFPSALFGMLSLFVLLSTISVINIGIATSPLLHGAFCSFSRLRSSDC
jgi:hypothetical protein